MVPLPQPNIEKIKTDSSNMPQQFLLLNCKQWSYVQHRYNLTPREREIAELICQGIGNLKIAGTLRIKQGTVKTHLRNIYRKVRVKNKIAMLLRFVNDTRELSAY